MRTWIRKALSAIAVSSTFTIIVYYILLSAGIDFAVTIPSGETVPLTLDMVIAAVVTPAIGATAVYGILKKYTKDANKFLISIAAITLVASFIPILYLETGSVNKYAFATIHLTAATTIVLALVRDWL